MASGYKRRIRNLAQYKDLTDEEFDEVWKEKLLGIAPSAAFEERITAKMADFAEDYDLDDLKINDKEALRALVQAIIALEDYEQHLFELRAGGVGIENLTEIDKLQRAMSDLRSDISRLQADLNITRKIRQSDRESSVIAYIDSLREKAREFYESRMMYIVCPKCNMLLGTLWTLYPDEPKNKIHLVCNRILDNGEKCGEKLTVTTTEMVEKGSNKPEVLPESML